MCDTREQMEKISEDVKGMTKTLEKVVNRVEQLENQQSSLVHSPSAGARKRQPSKNQLSRLC